MKALTLRPVWAMGILIKEKTVELRTWKTAYRGDILITSGKYDKRDTDDVNPTSCACCLVTLVDIVPFNRKKHFTKSWLPDGTHVDSDILAWELDNIRPIKPFKMSGKLSLFNVDDSLIELLPPELCTDEELDKIFSPFMLKPLYP